MNKKLLLVAVAIMALTGCNRETPKSAQDRSGGASPMQDFTNYFAMRDAERQKNVRSDALINSLRPSGQLNHVADVVWCGDNKTLVSSGGTDISVLMWEVQTGKVLHSLTREGGSRAIACSKSGKYVASGNSVQKPESSVRVWDIGKEEIANDIAGPFPPLDGSNNSYPQFLIFSPDDSRLFAHYINRKQEQRLVVYEVPSWKVISDLVLPGRHGIKPVLSTQGEYYAYDSDSKDIVVINALNGVEKLRIHTEKLRPRVLAFGRDDKSIFIGGQRLYDGIHQEMPEQVIEEYSLDDGKNLQSVVTGHYEELSALAFRQDSGLLISASLDKTIELRNSSSSSLIATVGNKTSQIYSVDIRTDGQQAASACGDKIDIWSLQ
jgi:WD40 repeat protein